MKSILHLFKLAFFLLFLCTTSVQAQWISVNDDGANPHESAALDINTTKRGILIPRMDAGERLTISSPAKGLLVFQNDGLVGFYFYNGSAWDTLGGASTVVNISNVTNVTNSGIAVARDLKGTGVDGGTFNSGSWQKRTLNDLSGDLSFVSLNADTLSLDSGTYVIQANAPAFDVNEHQIRLFNASSGTVETIGITSYSNNFTSSFSLISAVVSVNLASEKFILEHRCSNGNSGNGLGRAASWGDNVFSQVTITKL